jgi:glyoxylase-like metal-dependent hydrolase (beta-lactamase superfamily II)/rhodanese-related sulfurtransferase
MDHKLEIDTPTLQAWLENGHSVEVIDIRPRMDYEAWHIPGSLNVDAYRAIYAHSPGPLADYRPHDGKQVVAVCYVGQTSKIAAQYLGSRGIEALSLAGGMQAWSLSWNTAELPFAQSKAEIMQVRRTGKGCLSYLVASEGAAVVIDPSVDPQVYLDLAVQLGCQITKVLDTHIHADHLSRSRALAETAGATHYLPKQDRARFEHKTLEPGQTIGFGNSILEAIHTPGHTFESMSYLLDGEALFSGDTLFLDSVGRPDLKADREGTQARARTLYHTLQILAAMDPETIILPCHTSQPVPFDHVPLVSSLATVVGKVPALRYDEEQFVTWILERLPTNPPNYEKIVQLNEQGIFPELDPTLLEAGANMCAV